MEVIIQSDRQSASVLAARWLTRQDAVRYVLVTARKPADSSADVVAR